MVHPFPNTTWRGWNGLYPELKGNGQFVAEGARLIGDVQLGAESSVWFNAVLRADNAPIRIGQGTNIQDGTIVHTDVGCPVIVGDFVTIGHQVVLHGCTIHDRSLVGMGATIMNHAKIGAYSLVAAGSLVLEGFEAMEGGVLIMGSPAKIRRSLTPEERLQMEQNTQNYIHHARQYLATLDIA